MTKISFESDIFDILILNKLNRNFSDLVSLGLADLVDPTTKPLWGKIPWLVSKVIEYAGVF